MDYKVKTSPPPSRPESPTSSSVSTYSSNSHLPTPIPNKAAVNSATAKRYKYLRRLLKFRQMDFEFAVWQMVYLFVSPRKVYRNFQYRKQTKDQFARDDPAFLVLLSFWLCVSSVGFALVLQLYLVQFLKFLAWVIFVDCIGVGILVATLFWYGLAVVHTKLRFAAFLRILMLNPGRFVTNKYLRKPSCGQQDVEWGYAFDVHLNAFFPLLIILHVFQLFFYHVLISHEWFVSRLFGNSLYVIAIGYYVYVTFLGYSSLPILRNTQVLLYPLIVLALFFIVTLSIGWNVSISLMDFYKYRVV